ncbi:MAG: glycosyltransferase family 2 protein [Gemmatimonadaceae bacterium]
MDRLDLGVVVLNWNGLQDTLGCLASIYEQKAIPAYVVFVDNGSTDGSVAGVLAWLQNHQRFGASESQEDDVSHSRGMREFALHERQKSQTDDDDRGVHPRFVIIENERNLGFSAGSNVGIRFLLRRAVKYVLLLNNDTRLASEAFAILVAGMEQSPECQSMVPQIRYAGEPDRIWQCGAEWTWFGTPRYHYAEADVAALEGRGPFEVEMVSGCALLVRSSWLETHGILTERFFFGEEDIDLSWRMRATGRRSMYCWPQAVIYHKVGGSLTRRTEVGLLPKVYLGYLNRMIFLREAWGRSYRWQARRVVVHGYFVWMMIFKMGVSPSDALRVVRDFARDSREKNGVDAEFFSYLMHEKFKDAR